MKKRPKKNTKWHKLDNTANVFPVVASRRMTNVFRLTTVMNSTVRPECLQAALDNILPFFGAFCVRLRHGLFWSYFETNTARAVIEPEREAPCRYMNPLETNRYLFRVLYYENRIHLEVFHALTDGTGAMRFLKALSYEYIKQAFPNDFSPEQLATFYGTQGAGNTQDAYVKNYIPQKSKNFKETTAFRVKGEYRSPDNIGVLTAIMPVDELKAVCKSFNASITEYLTALFAYCIYTEHIGIRGSKKPVNMFVLVDLRSIFNMDTSVNFFSNIVVGVKFGAQKKSFEQVLDEVKTAFSTQINREYFEKKLSYTVKSETNLFTRVIPLPLKNGILRIIYEHSNRGSTMPFSNLGIQDPLPEFKGYIEGFRFLLYACEHDAIKCGAVSANGKLALTFTTFLEGFALSKAVARTLAEQGVNIEIESNGEIDEVLL